MAQKDLAVSGSEVLAGMHDHAVTFSFPTS